MRALLVAVLVAALLWAGYWVVGSRVIERSVTDWFATPHPGLTATQSDISLSGFPNRFDLTLTDPAVSLPDTGWGWRAPFAQAFMMTWKPWHLIAALPQEQFVETPAGTFKITSSEFEGSLILIPGTALALDRTVVSIESPAVIGIDGWEVSASKATFATRLMPDDAAAHEIGLEVTTLTPDANLRMALAGQSDLPEQIDRIHFDGTLALTAPLDRFAAQTRPQIRTITVKQGLIRWGSLILSAQGTVSPGPDGLAEGRIDLRVEGWRELVPVLIAAGLIKPEVSPTVTRALELLSQQGPDPTVLNVPLAFQSGRMSLGPLPLGPAPRLN